jgi:hypothetical protein
MTVSLPFPNFNRVNQQILQILIFKKEKSKIFYFFFGTIATVNLLTQNNFSLSS